MIDCHAHVGVEIMNYLRGEFPYAQHLVDLVRTVRGNGINRVVVFPMVTNLSLGLPALIKGQIDTTDQLEKVPYRFENRRLMQEVYELFPKYNETVIPFAMVDPLREVDAQIQSLQELLNDYSVYGIKIQSTILRAPIKSLLGPGRAFLELAGSRNIPVLIHSSVLPEDTWSQAHDILDIVEAVSNVRFCLAHSCRFDKSALDRLSQLPNAWFDCSAHCIHCNLAVTGSPDIASPEQRFEADYTRPEKVLAALADSYRDSLLWGSDAPYYSYIANANGQCYELRSTYEREVQCLKSLSQPVQRQIAHDNTLRFLGN